MRYEVSETGDDTDHLRNLLDQIGKAGGKVISVVWKPASGDWNASWVVVVEYED